MVTTKGDFTKLMSITGAMTGLVQCTDAFYKVNDQDTIYSPNHNLITNEQLTFNVLTGGNHL